MSHVEIQPELSGQDQQTYDAIFRHPTSGNIEWHSVLALVGHLGEVEDESNGKVKLTRNGQVLTLRPNGKDAGREEIADIRKFLQTSVSSVDNVDAYGDFLLVLVNAEARLYRSELVDSQAIHIEPYDPHGWDKHAHNPRENAPVPTSHMHHEFFEKVAAALKGARRILLFGDGKGSGLEFDRLVDDLNSHHRELAKLVIGSEAIDLSHMTDPEILALARQRFAAEPAQNVT